MSNPSKIKSKPYRNWVRGALGLFYLQRGLYPFTDRVVKAEHAKIVQYLTPCSKCAIENVLPAHAGGKVCIQKNKAKCNCKKKTNTNCGTCSKIYDDIVLQHRFREPQWVTNCSTWYNDHWQLAKCFLTTTIKGSNNTAAETDASGLLSIIINGLFFQSEIQCNIDPPNDSLSQVREIRNEILHNSTLELTDNDVARYLQSMIAVLEDKKALSLDPAAQTEAEKLKEILNDELNITTNEEANAIQIALGAIKIAKEQSEESIKSLAEEKLNDIKASDESIRKLAEEKQNDIKVSEESIRRLAEEKQNDIKTSEESIRKLAEEKQNDIKVSEESIRRLADEKQNEIKRSEESIRRLAAEKQNEIKAYEESIRKLAEEKQNYIKTYEESIIKLAEEKQNDIKTSEESIRRLIDEKQIDIKTSEESIRKLADEKQNDIKASEEGIRKLAEEKLNAIKASDESVRKLAEEKQNDIKVSEEGIRKLAEEKQSDIKASEQHIRKLAEEKLNAFKATEEKIKGIIEDSRTALQQQTSEAAQKLETVTEEAIENVASTASEVFKETFEPEIFKLSLGHGNHEKRIRAVEAEQHNLQMKQLELEKEVDKLTNIEKKHQARMEYLKQKHGLQQYLVDFYQQHHVKTWISPLMTQHNNVNIEDVYVSPRMVVENNKDGNDGNTSKIGNGEDTKNKHIERYRDLFSTHGKRNRNIFILGDVGTGKSSFCKMMMQNWCTAIAKREYSDDSVVLEEDDAKREEERNTCDMNQFDFLFYIPLREMSGHINTVGMIKTQLENYKVLIDDIFTNDSERILILADGLDEWTPPAENRSPSLHHVAIGIPTSRSVRDSTIITTSRPSSRGILNLKSSEYDLKVTLMGLDYTSVTPMIEKYMKLLNKTSAVSDFKGILTNLKLKDIQNAPLLLQQIIWLYCNNHDVGKSRTSIYLNIVNIILGWEHERMSGDPKLHEFQNSDLAHLPLPDCFDEFARCQENRNLLLLLARLAYDAYITGSDSSLVIGRYKLKQLGVSEADISAILRTGILTEVISADPTYEKSRLSFIHTSYLEFFAAVYMCSYYLSKNTASHSSGISRNILEGLIAVTPEPSAAEILRLENVLIMMCGLLPCLTEHIYDYIHKVSIGDNAGKFVVYRAQKLMFDCLSEHHSIHEEGVKLRHLHISHGTDEDMLGMLFCYLVPTRLETSSIDYYPAVSHEQCLKLLSVLPQAVFLQTLKIHGVKCTKRECDGHIIDLTKHRKLQSIELSGSKISVSGINNTCLESCEISHCELSHEQYSLLSSCLSQTVSLRTLKITNMECTKSECEGHSINLTYLKKILSLELSGRASSFGSRVSYNVSVSGLNPTFLESCKISNCELSHKQYLLLSSGLSNAVSLQTLEIDYILCTKDKCEGHIFYLTKNRKLQSLEIAGSTHGFGNETCSNISVAGINPTCLESCKISGCKLSHKQYSLLSSCVSQAVSLRTLEINGIGCTKYECEGHIFNLTSHRKLQSLVLSVRVNEFNSKIYSNISFSGISHTCLKSCAILDCKLTHEQITSLSSCLSQATSLQSLKLFDLEYTKIECEKDCIDCHDVDLTNHSELKELQVSKCNMISIIGVNPTCLEKFIISNRNLSHDQYTSLCTFLSHAYSLSTLKLCYIKCIEDGCAGHNVDLTSHKQLDNLSISHCNTISITSKNSTCPIGQCDISYCNLSHEQCTSLCTFLSHAESLYKLTLSHIKCTGDECAGHVINVTNHTQLHHLSISNCNMISITGVNPTCQMVTCYIKNCNLSHEQCASLCTFLTHRESLYGLTLSDIKCIEEACAGHAVNLTNHKRLSSLSVSNCNMINITGIISLCLKKCDISNCYLSHEQCTSLCTFLTDAEYLYDLTLSDIKCNEDSCAGHAVNLTNHKQLRHLSVSNCNIITITGINPTCLKKCDISNRNLSHEQCTSLCTFLTDAEYLDNLKLSDIKCIEDICAGHAINLNIHNKLRRLSISNCNMIAITSVNPAFLKECDISNRNLSHEQCTSLCTSLTHAEHLDRVTLSDIKCTEDGCAGHVIDLTNHKQLYHLSISNCNTISVTGINPACPASLWFINDRILTHEQGGSSCTLL